ncbi:MAG: hypothetical protein GX162_13905 [Firmicutes bacterium]|nr:hypothetical protein [Bacillota bacterium]
MRFTAMGFRDTYEIKLETETIHLEPGESRHITVDIVPKKRQIMFFDNGEEVLSIISLKP